MEKRRAGRRSWGVRAARVGYGFALTEALIAVVILALVVSIAVPVYANAARNGERIEMGSAAHDLYTAMLGYFEDHGRFPAAEEFDPVTLQPLVDEGYLHSAKPVVGRLLHERLLVYSAAAADGSAGSFWLLLKHRRYPFVFLVAHGDAVPGAVPGNPHDGVFVYRGGRFVAAGGTL